MKHLKHLKTLMMVMILSLLTTIAISCGDEEEDPIIYTVTVMTDEGGSADASLYEVIAGEKVTLFATPEKDYHFVNWTVDGVEVSTTNPYTATITTDTEFKANFVSFKPTGMENGKGYVDLGLSVKWATCNVGATTPWGYGDYFAWGETSPKTTYGWSTYKYCNGTYDSMTKYCTYLAYGKEDNKTRLERSDDAARVNWDGSWRMPTKAELYELENTNNCTWTYSTLNGVKGYKVTSKKNGNGIFLPAAGYHDSNGLLVSAGSSGFYWSSTVMTGYSYNASAWLFLSSDVFSYSCNRCYGQSVRPVCE